MHESSSNEIDTGRTADTECIEPLKKLAKGDYSTWRGFNDSCTRSDVSKALGESQNESGLSGDLGGITALYREYSNTPASPYGAIVWYIEDKPVALQMHTVRPILPIKKQLGPPEAKDLSRMPGFKTQDLCIARPTFHVDNNR
jgi:hypothetical protein